LSRKTRVLVVVHSKMWCSIARTVLTQYSSVTDRRTDGRPSHG